jgi:hypothetical protein
MEPYWSARRTRGSRKLFPALANSKKLSFFFLPPPETLKPQTTKPRLAAKTTTQWHTISPTYFSSGFRCSNQNCAPKNTQKKKKKKQQQIRSQE